MQNPPYFLTQKVLILVLVEDGLGEMGCPMLKHPVLGLNPCFGGRWSRSKAQLAAAEAAAKVLILVLVEDGLGAP